MQIWIRALTVGVTIGWVGVFATAAGALPWRPNPAIHVALVGLLVAGTIVAAITVLLYGPASMRAWTAGRDMERDAANRRRERAAVIG